MKLTEATKLLEFLDGEKVATLAVPIDSSGTLHIATMNCVHRLKPFCFYFVTDGRSEKCKLLKTQPDVVAACSAGTYVGTPFTLQMRGKARILDTSQSEDVLDMYFAKRGSKNKNVEGPNSVLIEFAPNWARFTDYAKGWDTTMLEL